jgi:hypothetical protein
MRDLHIGLLSSFERPNYYPQPKPFTVATVAELREASHLPPGPWPVARLEDTPQGVRIVPQGKLQCEDLWRVSKKGREVEDVYQVLYDSGLHFHVWKCKLFGVKQ